VSGTTSFVILPVIGTVYNHDLISSAIIITSLNSFQNSKFQNNNNAVYQSFMLFLPQFDLIIPHVGKLSSGGVIIFFNEIWGGLRLFIIHWFKKGMENKSWEKTDITDPRAVTIRQSVSN